MEGGKKALETRMKDWAWTQACHFAWTHDSLDPHP